MYDYRYGENTYVQPAVQYTDPLTVRVNELESTLAKLVEDFYTEKQPEVVTTNTANPLFDLGRDKEITRLKEEIARQHGQIGQLSADLDDLTEENDRLSGRLADAEYALNEIQALTSLD